MRGIILAGGTGSRLFPATSVVSKQLLPVFDKPMIYYPLAVLLAAGVRDVLVITTPRDARAYRTLLGAGGRWGAHLRYAVQRRPGGIPQALTIGGRFIGRQRVALILGDNIFAGDDVPRLLSRAGRRGGAHGFAAKVHDPRGLGVVRLDSRGRATALAEKPARAVSPWAVTGMYVFDAGVREVVAHQRPSDRGELEILDTLRAYLNAGQLTMHRLPGRTAWLDAGTPRSLLNASAYVASRAGRGFITGSPELAAVRGGLVSRSRMLAHVRRVDGEYARAVERALDRA